MADIILYETSTGGEKEGDYPSFVVDPDFAIYSPKVSGIKRKYSKELTSEEVSQGYIVQSTTRGDVDVEIIGSYSEGNVYQYEIYFYPRMLDNGLIQNTWFFSYDQNNDVFLDNWSNEIRVKQVNPNQSQEDISAADNTRQSVLDTIELGSGWFESSWFFLPNAGESVGFGSGTYYDGGNGWILHLFFGWLYISLLNDNLQNFWFFMAEDGSNSQDGTGVWMFASRLFLGGGNPLVNSFTYMHNFGDIQAGWVQWFDAASGDYSAIIYQYTMEKYYGFNSDSGTLFTEISAQEANNLGIVNFNPVDMVASFAIGGTLLNTNADRQLVHNNFGDIQLGYPDFLSDGIWMYIKNKILEIPELSNDVGWCWFNREYASSFSDGNFFWFADSASIEAASLTRIGAYTNGQCVLFYSQSAASMCAAIVNTSGELFISVLSDQYKTKYYKLVN